MKLFRHLLGRGLAAMAVAGLIGTLAPAASAGELTIYAGAEADSIKAFSEAFTKLHPSIKLNWVRDSTGIILARIHAEANNPRADVLFAMAASSMINLDQLDMLVPYTPAGIAKLNPTYLDKNTPAHWVGLYGWASAICFNTIEAQKSKLPKPVKWADLTNPVYKGKITMPDPASSGTGYLMVSAWLQLLGEEQGWAYMDKLHANIATYSHSGSKPCEQAASGEYPIGFSFPFRAAALKTKGAPIDVIIAEEGTGWEMQTVGILKGTKNLADARTFLDWAVSQGAMEAYGLRYEVTAMPVKVVKPEHFPADIEKKLLKKDFALDAKNQTRILAEWRKRYGTKTEPKK